VNKQGVSGKLLKSRMRLLFILNQGALPFFEAVPPVTQLPPSDGNLLQMRVDSKEEKR
jgi:hypothetical protein